MPSTIYYDTALFLYMIKGDSESDRLFRFSDLINI